MSNNSKVYPCYFRWMINPPFLPGQIMRAKFFQDTPSVTEWLVVLQLEEWKIGEWHVTMYLMFDTSRDEREEIVAKEVAASIYLDGKQIAESYDNNFIFNVGNRHKYFLETSTLMFVQTKPYQILVEIGIALEADTTSEINAQRCRERSLQDVSFDSDLECLSEDLISLARRPHYSNVKLYSKDRRVFNVHSFILMVRWRNFFRQHTFDTTANTVVKTNISTNLLRDILNYMYSAKLPPGFPESASPSYMAELFQVIERYGIHHFYKLFVDRTSFQLRVTKRSALRQSHDFRLQYIKDAPAEDGSLNLHPQEFSSTLGVRYNTDEFILRIEVRNLKKAGAWLSYTLRSKSNTWVYAQVILEAIKMGVGAERQRVVDRRITAHASNYSIHPHKTVGCGAVLFLGCLETFGDLPSTAPSGKIEQWFRFSVCFTDGTSLEHFQSQNTFSPNPLTRLDVLSNHMYELLSKEIHADMRIVSRSMYNQYDVQAVRSVHRAILSARVPCLPGLLVDFEPGVILPALATVRLREEALPYVIDYIYTGKVIDVPRNLLDQISDFAIRSSIPALKDLIRVLRNDSERSTPSTTAMSLSDLEQQVPTE